MTHEFVELLKRIFVEKQINTLTRGQLTRFVLPFTALCTASSLRLCVHFAEFFHAVMMIAE